MRGRGGARWPRNKGVKAGGSEASKEGGERSRGRKLLGGGENNNSGSGSVLKHGFLFNQEKFWPR